MGVMRGSFGGTLGGASSSAYVQVPPVLPSSPSASVQVSISGSGRRRFSETSTAVPTHREQPQTSYRDRAAERRNLYGSSSGNDVIDSNEDIMGLRKGSLDPTPFPPGVGGRGITTTTEVNSFDMPFKLETKRVRSRSRSSSSINSVGRLSDGRHLAYQEYGVSRQNATFKIVFIHSFSAFRRDAVIATRARPGFLVENGIYVVSYDRPGYGESDPHPKRNEKTLAYDVEQLADQLQLGSKFYVVGYSMGAQAVWGVLKYIPHRLAGATLLCPVINSWWPSFPDSLTWELWNKQTKTERFGMLVTHNTPWLLYWWNTQKLFQKPAVMEGSPKLFAPQDLALLPKLAARTPYMNQTTQQGMHESLDRDLIVGFGRWSFDPMKLENPFPNGEGKVHLWQGDDDRLVPIQLQRIIAQKLSWIKYNEIPGAGHFFPAADRIAEAILKKLLPIPQAS